MTYKTMAWAYEQEGLKPTHKFVLVVLADHADEEHSCFPSVARLEKITGLHRATVLRALAEMEEMRLLKREHRADANGHRKSSRFHLAVGQSRTARLWPESHGAEPESHPAKPESQDATDIRTTKRTTKRTTTTREVDVDAFGEFYAAFPRKVGKEAARKAFAKALLRGATAEEVLEGARRFAADPNLPSDRQFIPHPATWLNAGRWDDEALPSRNAQRQTDDGALALVAAYRDREGMGAENVALGDGRTTDRRAIG